MADTVRGKPWIHLKAAGPEDQRQELWLSLPRDVVASRHGDYLTRYTDLRSGVSYEYSQRDNKLLRLSVRDVESVQSMIGVFRAILRGDVSVGERFAEDQIVKQRRRTVNEQGQRWIEYELELQRGDRPDTALAVIRVDPETMLPMSLTITAASEKLVYAIDYPDDGPTDIYALGVPRDVAIVDRVPPPDRPS